MRHPWIGSTILLLAVAGTGAGLAAWKQRSMHDAEAASAHQPEPMESVTVAVAKEQQTRRMTTAIGTVRALQSITLRNEVPGTVDKVALVPGQIVDKGTVLVALDVAVEEAELKAQEAQAALAETLLGRMQRASENHAASDMDVDKARAERDVALAQTGRTRAIIARKTLVAPFRARVGVSDVHKGQYLEQGIELTTLQGVDEAVHVDFTVAQRVVRGLREGDSVDIFVDRNTAPIAARIIAIDARVDPTTRNATVRALIAGVKDVPLPGASVRVRVPVGPPRSVVVVPVTAVRKGPTGDHVFVVTPDKDGKPRAHLRPVESGTMLGDEMEVAAGVNAGEQVVAAGSFKLIEGMLVAIAPDAPAPDAPAPDAHAGGTK